LLPSKVATATAASTTGLFAELAEGDSALSLEEGMMNMEIAFDVEGAEGYKVVPDADWNLTACVMRAAFESIDSDGVLDESEFQSGFGLKASQYEKRFQGKVWLQGKWPDASSNPDQCFADELDDTLYDDTAFEASASSPLPAAAACEQCVEDYSGDGADASFVWCEGAPSGGCIQGDTAYARSTGLCGDETIVFHSSSCPSPPALTPTQACEACVGAYSGDGSDAANVWCPSGGCIQGNTAHARSTGLCGGETIVFRSSSCPSPSARRKLGGFRVRRYHPTTRVPTRTLIRRRSQDRSIPNSAIEVAKQRVAYMAMAYDKKGRPYEPIGSNDDWGCLKDYVYTESEKLEFLFETGTDDYTNSWWGCYAFLAALKNTRDSTFLFHPPNGLVISFTGTDFSDWRNAWADANARRIKVTFGTGATARDMWVHRGFFMSWKEVWDGGSTLPLNELTGALQDDTFSRWDFQLQRDPLGKILHDTIEGLDEPEVTIVGHSLGAAHAIITAVHLCLTYPRIKVHLTTAGAPRVFSSFSADAEFVQEQLIDANPQVVDSFGVPPTPQSHRHGTIAYMRLVNWGDPIPSLALTTAGFGHFGRGMLINWKGNFVTGAFSDDPSKYEFTEKHNVDYTPYNYVVSGKTHKTDKYLKRLWKGQCPSDLGLTMTARPAVSHLPTAAIEQVRLHVTYMQAAYNGKERGNIADGGPKCYKSNIQHVMKTDGFIPNYEVLYMTPPVTATRGSRRWECFGFLLKRTSDNRLILGFTGTDFSLGAVANGLSNLRADFWAKPIRVNLGKTNFPKAAGKTWTPSAHAGADGIDFMVHSGFYQSFAEVWKGNGRYRSGDRRWTGGFNTWGPGDYDLGLGHALHQAIESADLSEPQVIVVGHSLGGGQAVLAAVHVALAYNARVELTTAGGPRVFHRTYATAGLCASTYLLSYVPFFQEYGKLMHESETSALPRMSSRCQGSQWIQKNLVAVNKVIYDANFGMGTPSPGTLAVQRLVNTGDPIPALAMSNVLQLKHFGRAILINKDIYGAYSYTYKKNVDYTPMLTASPFKHMTEAYLKRLFANKQAQANSMQIASSALCP
jgi:pimeloyl-ACP methyl ester carboxylesterase